jgi:hypothetical protein
MEYIHLVSDLANLALVLIAAGVRIHKNKK